MLGPSASRGSASLPFFGVEPAILDENGKELQGECSGRLVLKRPVPSMMRTVYGDHARFEDGGVWIFLKKWGVMKCHGGF